MNVYEMNICIVIALIIKKDSKALFKKEKKYMINVCQIVCICALIELWPLRRKRTIRGTSGNKVLVKEKERRTSLLLLTRERSRGL